MPHQKVRRPFSSPRAVAINRFPLGGFFGGSRCDSEENRSKINSIKGNLEAGTGIEPVFTDLQSGLRR